MYAKLVVVDGREFWVSCVPTTPLSEVLRRAATQARIREELDRHNSPEAKAFREAAKCAAQTIGHRE